MTVLPGKTVGKYRIIERLGRGGMAEVYKAYHPGLDRHVAVKVMHPFLVEEGDFVGRFEREAAAVAKLRHPNIVQIMDFDHEGDVYYMVMEFIDGPTLKAELEERSRMGQPFDPEEATRILTPIGNAVDYAHRRGMVHRDLKPANIMFTAEGQPVLTDFGIAKIVGAKSYTVTGAVSGTPAYMSPEQGQGERGDERSDIYSLGVILYEMVTGRVPYDADTPFAIILKHIQDPLPLPRQVYPQLSESVERVILKTLSKEPDDRYQTAGEMALALQQAVVAPVAPTVLARAAVPPVARPPETMAAPPMVTVPAAEKPRFPLVPLLMGMGGLLLLVVLAAVGGYFAFGQLRATPTPIVQALVPLPTDTPYPTYTPYPTHTPLPTDTPTPVPTDTPYPTYIPSSTYTPLPTDTPTSPPVILVVTPTPLPVAPTLATEMQKTATPTATPIAHLSGKIAYPVFNTKSRAYDTYIINVDGTGRRLLADYAHQPAFRPDGVEIALVSEKQSEEFIVIMNVDGSGRRWASINTEDVHPTWSPNGKTIAFISVGRRLILEDAMARQPEHLQYYVEGKDEPIGAMGGYPVWLHDGRIALNSCNYGIGGGGSCGLFIMDLSGATPIQLTTDPSELPFANYKDEFVFISPKDGDWEIYKMNVSGAGLVQLTDNNANDGSPAWSPDGSSIAFVSDRDGAWGVWVMNADGSNQRKLLDVEGPGPDWVAEKISWAP
jgi:tRNA A-37 threonylcarbamoyl transferase component Bud32